MNVSIVNLQHKIPIPKKKITRAVALASHRLKLKLKEVSLVFVGQKRMRTINKTHLKHDYVTDVITFDYKSSGEIIICPSVAALNARQYANSVESELLLYVIHGLLHLAGFDDHKPSDIARMRRKEEELLNLL